MARYSNGTRGFGSRSFAGGRSGTPPLPTARLDAAQREAVLSDSTPILLLAGPGSGKTAVLTHRVARLARNGDIDPRRALVATFTRRAAAELRQRLTAMGVRDLRTVGTFHSIALTQIRQYEDSRELARRQVLADRRSLVSEVMADLRRGGRGGRAPTLSQVRREIDWACARGLSPGDYRDGAGPARVGDGAAATVAGVFARYVAVKFERRLLDFDDVLAECRRLLTEDEQFAQAQRWLLRHFFVDEFQDVNPVQFALLRAWLGGRDDLFVVGDPNQSIYGWNGAEPGYLAEFERSFPGATTLALQANHRSAAPIVRAAEAVLGGGGAAGAAGSASAAAASNPAAVRQTCRRSSSLPPAVTEFADAAAEAEGIAQLLRRRRGAAARSTWAVLARTHAQLKRLAETLDGHGIPCRLSGARTLLQRPEVVALRAELAGAGEGFVRAVHDLALDALDAREAAAGDDTPSGDAAGRPAGLTIAAARLLELAQTYIDERTSPTGARFDAWLRELTPADIDPAVGSAGTVDLVTFHAAKGLQWRHVVAAGTCAGVVPLVAGDPEERRLFYVAMTRAVDTLTLTWSADLGPSPWLADIAAVAAAADGAEAPVDPLERTVRLAEARARLDSAATDAADGSAAAAGGPAAAAAPDPATPTAEQTARRDRLTRWRSDAALARRIAPAAVLSDSSLAKISLRRPRTLDELVETTGQSRLRLRRVWEDLQEVLADD